jgi:hypothetical protein
MDPLSLLGILLTLTIVGVIVWVFVAGSKGDATQTVLQWGSTSGKTEKVSAAPLARSFNQPEGITFSYASWLLVNDFTVNYGKKRLIFSKGDCPGVYLDTTSNAIMTVIDTYGSPESVLISNIPARKWIHYALVVNQYSVDIYINGVLSQHHTLGQLPKQNDSSVVMGSNETGWDGVISNLVYYTRSLSASEVDAMSRTPPTDDLSRPPATPQYFDMSWYTGRGV